MLGVVSLRADEADGKEFRAMVKIINSLKVKPKVERTTDLGFGFRRVTELRSQ